MVLAQGIADRLKERREKFKSDLIAQGIEEGKVQGIEEGIAQGKAAGIATGRAELAAEIAVWNEKRLAAEARGEKFDEPPPTG